MIYNVVLVSGVQQSDLVIHIHISTLFQILFPYRWFFFVVVVVFLWLHWVFVAVCGLSLVAVSRGYSWLRCVGFSLWWLLVAEHGL